MSDPKKQSWNINGPLTAEWLRSLGLSAIKDVGGKLPEHKANLLIEFSDGIRDEEFWILGFEYNPEKFDWFVSLHVQRKHECLAHFWPARVKTREDVWRLFKALGLPPAERGE